MIQGPVCGEAGIMVFPLAGGCGGGEPAMNVFVSVKKKAEPQGFCPG